MPSVTFCADASPSIGGGHVMRCLTLADQLRDDGWDTSFCCSPETRGTIPLLENSGHRLFEGPICENGATDWLVIDHYGLDIEFEKSCRSHAKQIMVIDDLPTRMHECDILIDQNLGRVPEDYRGLVPSTAIVATGTAYALLRPQFAQARAGGVTQNYSPTTPLRLLITMGLTDPNNATEFILDALKESSSKITVDIVLGSNAPYLKNICTRASNLPFIAAVHTDVTNMAELLAKTDLVIGSAGSGSWERCCLGIPALVVILAENQFQVANALDKQNIAINLGLLENSSPKEIAQIIHRFIQSPEQLKSFARNAARICDGLGAGRVSLLLKPELAKDGKPVQLRPAREDDANTLLTWQSLPETRRYSRNPNTPTLDEHCAWYASKLSDTNVHFHFIEHHGEPAGILRLEKTKNSSDSFEVNILVSPEKYRLGIAQAALLAASRLHTSMTMVADVLPDNAASHALFKKAGFLHEDGLYFRRPL